MAKKVAAEKKKQVAAKKEVRTESVVMKRPRVYNGPAKGSDEAKARMAAVRAAQYRKNNLVPAPTFSSA